MGAENKSCVTESEEIPCTIWPIRPKAFKAARKWWFTTERCLKSNIDKYARPKTFLENIRYLYTEEDRGCYTVVVQHLEGSCSQVNLRTALSHLNVTLGMESASGLGSCKCWVNLCFPLLSSAGVALGQLRICPIEMRKGSKEFTIQFMQTTQWVKTSSHGQVEEERERQ